MELQPEPAKRAKWFQFWLYASLITAGQLLTTGCTGAPEWKAISSPPQLLSTRAQPAETSKPTDLLSDGSFESISTTGVLSAWEGVPVTGVSADIESKIDGRQSLRVEHPTWEGNLRLVQHIVGATPLTRYRLRGYLKCANLPQLAFLSVQSGRKLRVTQLAGLGDGVFQTQDWTEFAIDFTTPSQQTELAIAVNCDKPLLPDRPVGTLWIDGLSLIAIANEQ